MHRPALIAQRLRKHLETDNVQVADESHHHAGHEGAKGGGGHYTVTVVSAHFAGQNTVARHRMIYEALGDMMKKDIHALSIKALAPDEV